MPYKDKLRIKENIDKSYKIVNAKKELESRRNNPYVDVEAYFYDVFDENNNFISCYEVEVHTKTKNNKETLSIKKLN